MDCGSERKDLILYGLDPGAYEHPLDSKALNSLEGTPGLENLLRKINEYGVELFLKTQYTGSNIKVTSQMFPEIHNILVHVCETVHLKPVPDLYITQDPVINAFTVGSENPIIVLNTKTVECLTEKELQFIIGHEVGHIKSQHVLYHMLAAIILPSIGDFVGKVTLGIGGLLTDSLQLALLTWQRKSEFTSDRAGLLACQDRDAAITAFMKIAGAPESHYNNLDPEKFLAQAREFKGFDESNWKAIIKFVSVLGSTHPWTVVRCAELDKWIVSGEYQRLLDTYGRERKDVEVVCGNCGNKLINGARFCGKCGLKVPE